MKSVSSPYRCDSKVINITDEAFCSFPLEFHLERILFLPSSSIQYLDNNDFLQKFLLDMGCLDTSNLYCAQNIEQYSLLLKQ